MGKPVWDPRPTMRNECENMIEIIQPQLIITDLDATLVIKHQNISERAKRAIEICQRHGCMFGIASGRPLCQIMPSLTDWGIKPDVIIAFNGCQLYDGITDTVTNYFPMKGEWIKEVLEEYKDFNFNPNIVTDDGLNYFGKDPTTMFSRFGETITPTLKPGTTDIYQLMPGWDYKVVDDWSIFCQDNPKIMLRMDSDEECSRMEKYIAEHPNPNYHGFRTGPGLIEFANKNVSKGFALHKFCEFENIDISKVIGMGDTSNDNELLIEAGYGVCMQNGTDDTKKIADIITDLPCDQDGWADFIEKAVLIPNHWE